MKSPDHLAHVVALRQLAGRDFPIHKRIADACDCIAKLETGTRSWRAFAPRLALLDSAIVQADAIADGTRQTAELLTRLLAFPGLPALSQNPPPGEARAPVLIIHFKSKETSLRLFTTIATLGTPHDVTLQEIRVECFFPMDDPTAQIFRGWAGGAGGPA